jgi:hypothetical protein
MRDKEKQKEYNKMYRQKNPELIKKIQKEYYDKHRDKRIKNAQNWQKQNKEKALETRRAYMSTTKGRLNSVKASANTRKIVFELTDEQAISIMEKPCHYCGENSKIGIDRIDSDKNYTLDNSLPCCAMCNKMKNTYSKNDFISQCKKIAYFLGNTT